MFFQRFLCLELLFEIMKMPKGPWQAGQKCGAKGFKVSLEILSSCVTDVFTKKAPELSFIKSEKLFQASQWVESLQESALRK